MVQKATRTVAPGATRMRRRIEKIGSRTAPTEFDSGRLSITAMGVRTLRPRPRNRALSVSNSGGADGFAVDDGQMRGPDFRLGRRPSSPRRQDRADVGEIFRFDEQLRKGGMRDVGA